jgi:hypothetical protein
MAAPRKYYKDLKDVPMYVYVPDDFKYWIEQQAKQRGTSVSGLMRQWAYEKASEIKNTTLD